MLVDVNVKATFKRALFIENPKWLAVQVIFKVENRILKHIFFGPTDYRKRKQFNTWLRHLFEVITNKSYDTVTYNPHFENVCLDYCTKINKYRDTEFYIKTLPNNTLKFIGLGFEEPFISRRPDLEWGELEELRLDAWNEKLSEEEDQGGHAAPQVVIRHRVAPLPTPDDIPKNLKPIPGTINKPISQKMPKGNLDDLPF